MRCLLVILIAVMSCAEVASASGPGSFDFSFGQGGVARSPLPPATSNQPSAGIATDAAGRIIVADQASIGPAGGETGFAITRLLPDGRLDEAFGDKGVVTLQLGRPRPNVPAKSFATSVAIEPDTHGNAATSERCGCCCARRSGAPSCACGRRTSSRPRRGDSPPCAAEAAAIRAAGEAQGTSASKRPSSVSTVAAATRWPSAVGSDTSTPSQHSRGPRNASSRATGLTQRARAG